jgi:hypothetical protein
MATGRDGLPRYRQWVLFLYGITLSVLANWVVPHWWATTPLFTIAIGLPAIFLGRNYIWRTIGVLLALAGSIWFIFLAVR